jgi:hypothetical protein
MKSSLQSRCRSALPGIAAVAFAIFVLAETSIGQQIQEYKVPATGQMEYFTSPRRPRLDGGSFISERYISVDFHTFLPVVSANQQYLLILEAATPSGVNIESGPSLTLTLDQSELVPLEGLGSCGSRRRMGDVFHEAALYALSQDQMLRIGRARTVTFRLAGSSQSITGSWSRASITDAASLAARGAALFHALPDEAAANHLSHGEEYSAHLPDLGLHRVEGLMAAKEFDCAARLLDDVLAVDESAHGYFLRGEIARRRSSAPDAQQSALAAYERATEFADAPADAYRQEALLHRARGEHKDAIAAFRRYLELAPTAADVPLVHQYLQEQESGSP